MRGLYFSIKQAESKVEGTNKRLLQNRSIKRSSSKFKMFSELTPNPEGRTNNWICSVF